MKSMDLADLYLSKLSDAHPLDRDAEIRAAEEIERADTARLETVLQSGVPLPELAALGETLRQGHREMGQVVRHGEDTTDKARRTLQRRLRRVENLDRRRSEIRARLRLKGIKATERKRLREELVSRLEERNATVRRLGLARDRTEALIERVRAALSQREEAEREAKAGDADATRRLRDIERELELPRVSLRKLTRDLHQVERDYAEAKHELIEANLRLVVLFAKKHLGRGVPLTDLVQEGNVALMRAAEKFDHRVGTRFSTYAAWWIRQAMTRALIGQGQAVRTSVHMGESIRSTREVSRRLSQELGREPTSEEIADEMGTSADEVRKVLGSKPHTVSLDAPIGDEDGDRSVGDLLTDDGAVATDDAVIDASEVGRVLQLLDTLSPRERQILRMRFGMDGGDNRTLQEIGEGMSLSRERIRQLEMQALRKLRTALEQQQADRSWKASA